MRYAIALLVVLLMFGCINLSERSAVKNSTVKNLTTPETNKTPPHASPPNQSTSSRYRAEGFSFVYPSNMMTEESKGSWSGIFSGTHKLADGQIGEKIIVAYINTKSVYGANQDNIYQDDPTTAASNFLQNDITYDPAEGLLSSAYFIGEQSTFAIARDGSVAEVPFSIIINSSGKHYYGYAMDIYIPERSTHIKTRVIALDQKIAKSIRDNFLLSFRLE